MKVERVWAGPEVEQRARGLVTGRAVVVDLRQGLDGVWIGTQTWASEIFGMAMWREGDLVARGGVVDAGQGAKVYRGRRARCTRVQL